MPRGTGLSFSLLKPSPRGGRGWRASARRVRGQVHRYRSQHAVDIAKNFMVPEADHLETLRFEESRARGIGFCAVLSAIDLDNQPRVKADEIRDVGGDNNLPSEFSAAELPVAQLRPQQRFRVGRVAPQVARPVFHFARHHSPSPGRFATTLSRRVRGYKAMIA